MVNSLVKRIENGKDRFGLDYAQELYRKLFLTEPASKIYAKWQAEVDEKLESDGYGECIVKE